MKPGQSSTVASASSNNNNNGFDHDHHHDNGDQDHVSDLSQLPKARGWLKSGVSLYQGFWFPSHVVPAIINFQRSFQAHDQDIIVASKPKSGTTWLKALVFSVVNRTRYTPSNTPLLASNPHQLVPYFELMLYSGVNAPDLSGIAPPRLFSTHLPYSSLPENIKRSKCRIVYVGRNLLDTIVSFWHFSTQNHPDRDAKWTLEDCVDSFCEGHDTFGPFWDHVLGFWKESLESREKVLFLKYEDMKEDTAVHVKRIAEFVGFPFSKEEERGGVIEQICELCSLSSLRDLQVKKEHENVISTIDNKSFYRKGEVGDWVSELSPSMVERVEKVIKEKMSGSSLTFKTSR